MATCSECSEISKPGRQGSVARGAGRLLLALLLLLGGCAGTQPQGAKGSLDHTDEAKVTKLFESNTVLPDHVYYYSGPEAEPEAIIGIQAGTTFQGRYWHQVALTPGQLQAWNRRIDNAHRVKHWYRGAGIMAPDGRQVGIWYSLFDHTVIRFPDANTVLIYTPGPLPVGGSLIQGDLDGQGAKGRGAKP